MKFRLSIKQKDSVFLNALHGNTTLKQIIWHGHKNPTSPFAKLVQQLHQKMKISFNESIQAQDGIRMLQEDISELQTLNETEC